MGTSYNTNVVSDGLIACWDAGNRRSYPGAGTTWTDLAGAQNGTMENMNTGGFDSQKGGIIEFDGTDEYVDMGSSNQILPGGRNPFTISLWLKPDSQGDTQEGLYSFNQPDDDQEGSTTYAFGILWEPSASGETYAFYAGQRGLTTWGPSKASGASREDWVDTWCCITITYNGEGTKSGHANYRFYINDVNYALSDISGWGGTVNFNRLGNVTTVTTHSYTGDMANLSVWNRALSAAEIKQNYEALKPRFEPRITKSGLVGNWDAGDPASYNGGSTWKDTANGSIGTLVNDISFDSANGGFLQFFDGTDAYVNIGHVGFFSEGTIELWIRYDTAPVEESNYRQWGGNDYFEVRHSTVGAAGASTWDISANTMHSVKNSWSTAVWYQQVWTWKYSSTTGSIYFDGEFDKTGTITQDPSALASAHDMYIMRSSSSYAGYVPGKLAVFRVYNRALSAAEVLENYQAAKARFGH